MILRRQNVSLFCEPCNMWMFEGCWAAPHRLISPVLARLKTKKEPRVSIKDISGFMDGGFYTS